MSVIRRDITTQDWVLIAPHRGDRPHDHALVRDAHPVAAHDPSCPFCPGNEALTPPEVFRIPEDSNGWAVRVVPNKFGVLTLEGPLQDREDGSLFREMTGVGVHEVIVETPLHNGGLGVMAAAEIELVLRTYQARYQVLRADPRVACILIFKNNGERAGTSLVHPHSQLVALPVVPMQLRQKVAVAKQYFDDQGRCLYCDLVQAEVEAGVRLVWISEPFVVFHPFASHAPFETWIAPTQHQPSFGHASREELATLARVLKKTLQALADALGAPDFNLILHMAPIADETRPYYLWHLQIIPRVTTIAGFELGSGMAISTMRPEETAAIMRDVMAHDNRGGQ